MSALAHSSERSASLPLHSRFAHDRVIRPLLADFAKHLPLALAAIERSASMGAWDELARLAHKLKGEAATYGYPTLAEVVSQVEQFALATDVEAERIGKLIKEADGLIRRAQAALAPA